MAASGAARKDTRHDTPNENPLLSPFPDWDFNGDIGSCSNLQSVQSMEIDTRGIMWVIDGVRINNYTRCPAKLVFLDLNNEGRKLETYIFPEKIASQYGGFLNDIMVDETDGDFAYITDNSPTDPGIIVYSRKKNASWKMRDTSMQPNPKAIPFYVDGVLFDASVPVDGIALSPFEQNGKKRLFYCAMSSFTVYSVNTNVVKTKSLVRSGKWRRQRRPEGEKSSQSDGMVIDELSTMYLTMLPFYGVASWKADLPTSTMRLVYSNRATMVWPDGFAFDQQGFLYVISNKVFNYIDLRQTPEISRDTPFRVLRTCTGTRSYLYG